MDTNLFQNDVEKHQHENAVEVLCNQYPEQCELIRSSYEEKLYKLLPEATIRSYLPIFISRDIRRALTAGR